jgi:hypothetical protein
MGWSLGWDPPPKKKKTKKPTHKNPKQNKKLRPCVTTGVVDKYPSLLKGQEPRATLCRLSRHSWAGRTCKTVNDQPISIIFINYMMHNFIVGEVPVWKKTQYAKSIAKRHWWEKSHTSKSVCSVWVWQLRVSIWTHLMTCQPFCSEPRTYVTWTLTGNLVGKILP